MSDLDRVLGRTPINEATSAACVPEMSAPLLAPKRRRKEGKNPNRRSHIVSSVLGMSESEEDEYEDSIRDDEPLIPDSAEEIDKIPMNPGISLDAPKLKKRDPDSPREDGEKLLTPRAALVAPDVTPDSMTEIDPADIPGTAGETFKAADAAQPETPSAPSVPRPQQDAFTTTMDTLLGRNRQAPAARKPIIAAEAISPERAASFFRVQADPVSAASVPITGDVVKQGVPMQEHVPTDGKAVFEAARRYI